MSRPDPPAGKPIKQNRPVRTSRKAEREAARQRDQRRRLISAAGIVIAILIVTGVGFVLIRQAASGSNNSSSGKTRYFAGSAAYCITAQPPFVQKLGFSSRAEVDTRSQDVRGMVLFDFDQTGKTTHNFQDPSWTNAGYLGPVAIDRAGNIYAIPIPAINIFYNPPDKANVIYRIDGQTGKMSPLIDLAAAAPIPPDAAYGLLGISYDCDTNSLYATTVLGSSPSVQAGQIVRIDLATGQIASRIAGIDAFGVAVFNTAQAKRLYFGLARSPQVMSVALDDRGNFSGDLRADANLANLGFHGDERARLISFPASDTMQVQTIQFDFNLVAPTETRQTAFQYRYDSAQARWQLVSAHSSSDQNGG